MHNNLNSLIKIAKTLDSNGYYKEADQIQQILNIRLAGGLRLIPSVVEEAGKIIPRLFRTPTVPRAPVRTPTTTTPPGRSFLEFDDIPATHTPTTTTPPVRRIEIDDIPPVTHTSPVTVEDAVDAARSVDRAVEDVSVADARRVIRETGTEDLARDIARYEPEFVEEVIEDLRRGRRVEVTDRTKRIYEFGKRMRLFNPEQLKNIDRLHDFGTSTRQTVKPQEELDTPPRLRVPPQEELETPPRLRVPPQEEFETPPRLKTPPRIIKPPKIPPIIKPDIPDLPDFDFPKLPVLINPGGEKAKPIKGGYYYEPEGT
jgi:hypothetical protein